MKKKERVSYEASWMRHCLRKLEACKREGRAVLVERYSDWVRQSAELLIGRGC